VDGTRLATIAMPMAGAGTTGAAPALAVPEVLDRVVASHLDRAVASVRWGIGAGCDDATAGTRAAAALQIARERGVEVGFATGDLWRDALLADLELALSALLDDLTPRQAEIARLVLVNGARQVEVAQTLGVSRATVSVAVSRGRLPAIAGVRRAMEALLVSAPGARPGPGGAATVGGGSQ
jgi:DNA-binding CsgD family transcriptional regulator